MGQYKEENGTTRVGDFLRGLGDLAKPILEAGGSFTGQKWLTTIASHITTSKELKEEQKSYAMEMLKMDTQDIANARDMQKAALRQSDLFSKRFVYYLASFWSIIGGLFIIVILFCPVPEQNTRLIDVMQGFLLGTIIASIITFFFGSSEGSKEKTNGLINNIMKKS